MTTLSEYLKSKENQSVMMDKIIECLRNDGTWGKRGLFTSISSITGVSPAYAGQVLTGKKPLTDTFVEKIAVYLGVTLEYLRGEHSDKFMNPEEDAADFIKLAKDLLEIYTLVPERLKSAARYTLDGLHSEICEFVYHDVADISDEQKTELAGLIRLLSVAAHGELTPLTKKPRKGE